MPRRAREIMLLAGLAALLVACSRSDDPPVAAAAAAPPPAQPIAAGSTPGAVPAAAPLAPTAAAAPPAETPLPAPADPAPPASPASDSPEGQAINASVWSPAAGAQARRDALIRLEVLLDRAHFSPGVIDGRPGANLDAAIAAYETAHGLAGDGRPDRAVWDALTAADPAPVMTDYVITAEDVKGPFIGKVPERMEDMAKLRRMDYESPLQELAERFHMDGRLLAALNPNADFGKAGTRLVVAAPGAGSLGKPVARVEVDKGREQVRALDEAGKPVAVYPATVGSQERPAPSGAWAVADIVRSPSYTYDPSRLSFGTSKTKFTIPPGPNNPVGSTWIGLTAPTYGIHGSPDPALVGKVASHGCVRLTNWDARQLASAVRKGTPVVFVGEEARRST